MLDVASAEDCGFLPTHIYGEDTRIPLNINDEDIPAANMLTSPPERDEFTEMTFSLIRVSCCIQHRSSKMIIMASSKYAKTCTAFKMRMANLPWAFSQVSRVKLMTVLELSTTVDCGLKRGTSDIAHNPTQYNGMLCRLAILCYPNYL